MRIPSSAKTAPFSGCMSANSRPELVHARRAPGSSPVKTRGSTARRASSIARERPRRRPPRARSSARSPRTPRPRRPAPSSRPTITWPAIAIASSTSARKTRAGTRSGARRARRRRSAPARRSRRTNDAISAAVRTKMCRPITSSAPHQRRGAAAGRRRGARAERRRRTPAPIPACASTVPHAEPSIPQLEAVDEEQLEHDVERRSPATTISSGVRRSPRRRAGSPDAPSARKANGRPSAAIRR